MALQKGGPGAEKVRGATILCPKKRQLKQVFAYERLVIKKVRLLFFNFFPKMVVFSKKEKKSLPFNLLQIQY